MIKKIIRYFDELFFPRTCPFCEKIMDYKEGLVCGRCVQVLPFVGDIYCRKCGKKVEPDQDICEDCREGRHLFYRGRSVFCYEGMVSQSLINFKYHGRRFYGTTYAMWIERCLGDWIRSMGVDIIIPVPIHRKRMKKRTYNQAALIGKALSDSLHIPFDSNSLKRSKNTSPQKKLSAMERMVNMQNAFIVENNVFRGKCVLIVDDIYTTGLTMDAVSLALMDAKASKICFVTVSSGRVR